MKNLSTLIKLSTLLIIGGGTVGAAVGVTEAQMRNNDIVENNEFVHAAENGFKPGTRLYVELNSEWKSAGQFVRFEFSDGSGNKAAYLASTDSKNDNLRYFDIPENFNNSFTNLKFLRGNKEGTENWDYTKDIKLSNYNSNFFIFKNGWKDFEFDQFYADIFDTHVVNSVEITKENRDNLINVFLDRNSHFLDGYTHYIKVNKKDGTSYYLEPCQYTLLNKGKDWDSYLANFVMNKNDYENSVFQDAVVSALHRNIETERGSLTIFDSISNDITFNSKNYNEILDVDYNNGAIKIRQRRIRSAETPSQDLITKLFNGINSCSNDKLNGKSAFPQIVEIYHLGTMLEKLKNYSFDDFKGMEVNPDGSKTPVGSAQTNAYLKYCQLLDINPNPANLFSTKTKIDTDGVIIASAILGFSAIVMVGFVFLNKKRKPLIK